MGQIWAKNGRHFLSSKLFRAPSTCRPDRRRSGISQPTCRNRRRYRRNGKIRFLFICFLSPRAARSPVRGSLWSSEPRAVCKKLLVRQKQHYLQAVRCASALQRALTHTYGRSRPRRSLLLRLCSPEAGGAPTDTYWI